MTDPGGSNLHTNLSGARAGKLDIGEFHWFIDSSKDDRFHLAPLSYVAGLAHSMQIGGRKAL